MKRAFEISAIWRLRSAGIESAGLAAAVAMSMLLTTGVGAEETYFRLQVKQGLKFLDAVNCSDRVALHPGSTYADGACQLWHFVPVGGGWNRLQLKHNGKYLDAVNCSDRVALHPGSTYADGACQLWRFVPAGDGWYRLQLKQGEKYLDAVNCSDEVAMNPGSTYANGACQLWRFVRAQPTTSTPPAAPAPVIAPSPATPPPQVVTKVDEWCYQYARRAVDQFKIAQSTQGCAVNPDGRWQGNYDAHYNWCLTAPENWRGGEQKARDDHLYKCGAQHRY